MSVLFVLINMETGFVLNNIICSILEKNHINVLCVRIKLYLPILLTPPLIRDPKKYLLSQCLFVLIVISNMNNGAIIKHTRHYIHTEKWSYKTHNETHWGETLSMHPLWQGFLKENYSYTTPEDTHRWETISM